MIGSITCTQKTIHHDMKQKFFFYIQFKWMAQLNFICWTLIWYCVNYLLICITMESFLWSWQSWFSFWKYINLKRYPSMTMWEFIVECLPSFLNITFKESYTKHCPTEKQLWYVKYFIATSKNFLLINNFQKHQRRIRGFMFG